MKSKLASSIPGIKTKVEKKATKILNNHKLNSNEQYAEMSANYSGRLNNLN